MPCWGDEWQALMQYRISTIDFPFVSLRYKCGCFGPQIASRFLHRTPRQALIAMSRSFLAESASYTQNYVRLS